MLNFLETSYSNYSRAAEICVICLTIVIFILLLTSYVNRTRAFRIFCGIVGIICLAAITNVCFNETIKLQNPKLNLLVYILRWLYEGMLFNVFFLFTLYIIVITNYDHKKSRIVAIASTALFLTIMATDVLLTVTKVGFVLGEDGTVIHGTNIFMVGYIAFVILIAVIIFAIRKLVYKRVLYGFYGVMALSIALRFGQLFMNESSLTTITFAFPTLAMLYIMHSNPYNISIGTLDIASFENTTKSLYTKHRDFIIMSLYLPDYVGEAKEIPEVVSEQIRRFAAKLFHNALLFKVNNGHFLLVAKKLKGKDYRSYVQVILREFGAQYLKHRIPFKIVYGSSIEEISKINAYLSLIENINASIPENSMHSINEKDIERFRKHLYVISELEDIYKNGDLDDPRVLVYCQPVYNIKTRTFDSAESLMRLNLEKMGMVYPDMFISLAEQKGFIHKLTLIILNKTCQSVKRFMNEGFNFKRISVNVSALELKDESFCKDIIEIIKNNDIPGDKIAIELTESTSELDFDIMKKRINILKNEGIKFYLDDFGTGYSNMERIIELPFDIIKFDRSMVIASGVNDRSLSIVKNLARMFSDLEYSVLYEGIEDSKDEDRCVAMAAKYLQGYKYSRPIPVDNLREFFKQSEA